MTLPPKICPECAEEYLHSVESCVHCEVPLVHEDQLAATPARELPATSELTAIRVASAGWALGLSERLLEESIPHRVEPASRDAEGGRGGSGQAFGVYVLPDDLERARNIDAQQMQREIPDLPEGWDQSAEAPEGCPACGAAVAEGAAECPDCGLALAGPE